MTKERTPSLIIDAIIEHINERRKLEQKLRESEKLSNLISENANDLIAILNDKFEFEYINESVHKQLLGYSKQDLIGTNTLNLIHPNDLQIVTETYKKEFLFGQWTVETRIKTKEGNYMWLEIRGKFFFDMNKNKKTLIISRDITKRKEAELLVKKEINELKKLNELRVNFINRASHEIKTPITSIYGASKMALEIYNEKITRYDFLLSPKFKEFLEIIVIASKRLKDLTLDLLDISYLEANRLNLNKKRINISETIRECVFIYTILAEERKIEIITILPETLYIYIDEALIYRVFQNLIINAINYTLPHGKIFIKNEIKNESLFISIQDTGIGLTPNELTKLFTKFGKIERSEKNIVNKGIGFGLFLSRDIIKLHNGEIWAYSKGRNKGTSFFIKLPLQ